MSSTNSNIKLQPWGEFADFNRFGVPGNQIKERIEDNLNFYSGNYLFIVGAVILLNLFMNINLLVAVGILTAIAYFLFVVQSGSKKVGSFVVTPIIQMVIFGVISVIVIYKISGLTLLYSILFALVFVLAHGAFRMRNLKNKASNFVNGIKSEIKGEFN
ncbi:hypothetical protein DICPUDRAFT_99208 [Dictyostelium purpureum]|uniref:PRA1 family protein n=1 Tax=Dictyostelium purpureum TaxID=5786 RepID=F0ZX73_DICPU|nr:uncharacterized protein DICPUDRAFT_99208 [Dictyostelium purpureum]EGC31454.1 hypothetical protein DICPUDRAFT_99208 [Dictyostelium purpureum]|eukprot:XP_003292023.1 hypothetical protein DICPUDRAFT_99208 [Dictyostelium purpureum]